MTRKTTVLALLAVGLLVTPLWAQENGEPPRRDVEGVRFVLPPDISIKSDVRRLESTMENFTGLMKNLDEVNRELSQDFERYLENPQDELLASGLERKMAEYAEDVVGDFDRIIANQDVLVANFKLLTRKLGTFDQYLGDQAAVFRVKVDELETTSLTLDKELIELAVAHREADDDDEQRELKRLFSAKYSQYRMQQRYLNGYQRNLQSYDILQKNLELLVGLFDGLQGKFVQLIQNLEREREFLLDSIKFQANLAHLKLFMKENFVTGENSVVSVAEKLATLYKRVNSFTQVYDQINTNMGGFIGFNQGLLDVASQLDQIGEVGLPNTAMAIDMKMEEFADREDLLGDIEDRLNDKNGGK